MQPLVKKIRPSASSVDDADDDRQQRPLVAFEDAERQVPHQQDAGNENRSDVAIVETMNCFHLAGEAGSGVEGMVMGWLMQAP